MLKITVPETEMFDEKSDRFIKIKKTELTLEHSLVSLSKWESKWNKPFLGKENKTLEETIDYIRCMTLTQNVDPRVYMALNSDIVTEIVNYIQAPMTATWFREDPYAKKSNEIVTSELIYYWMISLQIPFECERWHLNRLLTLIRVCSIKNEPPKKMSKRDIMSRNHALNEARRMQHNSHG